MLIKSSQRWSKQDFVPISYHWWNMILKVFVHCISIDKEIICKICFISIKQLPSLCMIDLFHLFHLFQTWFYLAISFMICKFGTFSHTAMFSIRHVFSSVTEKPREHMHIGPVLLYSFSFWGLKFFKRIFIV